MHGRREPWNNFSLKCWVRQIFHEDSAPTSFQLIAGVLFCNPLGLRPSSCSLRTAYFLISLLCACFRGRWSFITWLSTRRTLSILYITKSYVCQLTKWINFFLLYKIIGSRFTVFPLDLFIFLTYLTVELNLSILWAKVLKHCWSTWLSVSDVLQPLWHAFVSWDLPLAYRALLHKHQYLRWIANIKYFPDRKPVPSEIQLWSDRHFDASLSTASSHVL